MSVFYFTDLTLS